jgi:serine/threonine protein kinase
MTDDRTQIINRSSTIEIGTELNQTYRIDSLIAVGGMGEVFKGHNIQTGDPVAIKVVLPEYARDEMIFELFRKEARVLNHLSHDAIVRYYVFSLDRNLGRPYLAMEFVDGPSLAERMKSKTLSSADFFTLLRLLADGLHKAHEAGVIHRDISPDNVILPGGLVEKAKIIDFGIARSATVGGGTLLGGSFAGKYSYVSPEQLGLFGGEVTPKSDIYSLGLTMAAAVRGQPIDMSGSQVDVIEKRRKVPDLALLGIPPEIRPILNSMLQPDPASRPASMAEVRNLVEKEQAISSAKSKDNRVKNDKSKKQVANQIAAAYHAQSAGASKTRALSSTAMVLGLVAVVAVGVLGGWIYVQSQQSVTVDPIQRATNSQSSSAANQPAAPAADVETSKPPQQASAESSAPPPVATPVQATPPQQQAKAEPLPAVPVTPPLSSTASATNSESSSGSSNQQPAQPQKQVVAGSSSTNSATPAAVASSSNQIAAEAPKSTPPPPPTAVKSVPKFDMAAVTNFVSSYGASGCLKTEVVSMSEVSAKLAALGTEASRSDFERNFALKAGYSPEITFSPVMAEQCGFVSALNKLPPNPAKPLRIKLDRTEIRGNQPGQSAMGDALNVTVTGIGERNAYLYVVDYAGGIQNISRACPNCIKMKSGDLIASLSLSPPDNSDGTLPKDLPMMIFAVAASKPLLTLNDQDAYETDAFVPPLLKAAASAEDFAAQSAYVTLKQN